MQDQQSQKPLLHSGRPNIMGILNVTPDSFSDGGLHDGVQQAVDYAFLLIEEGADLLDIGGESTRPGAATVSVAEELERVLPVLEQLAGKTSVPLSIDTRKPAVAREALRLGCRIVNDIGGLREPEMVQIAAEQGATVLCMHMLGEPGTMQKQPQYRDVVREVAQFLGAAAEKALQAGLPRDRIWLDPGIGFGKTFEHNLLLLRELLAFQELGFPVVVGASRKSFLGPLSTRKPGEPSAPPRERTIPSVVTALEAARRGASVLRVHDVAATRQALWTSLSIEAAEMIAGRWGRMD